MHLRKFILIVLALTSQAAFSQNNSLEQELEQLKTQIEQLTQRLDRLEQKTTTPSPAVVEATPTSPWQQLKIGIPSWKVEKYLGKPISKTKGSIEHWFYSDEKKNGPMVKFVLGTVHSWREPQR